MDAMIGVSDIIHQNYLTLLHSKQRTECHYWLDPQGELLMKILSVTFQVQYFTFLYLKLIYVSQEQPFLLLWEQRHLRVGSWNVNI